MNKNSGSNFGEVIGIILVLLLLFYLISYLFNTRTQQPVRMENYANNQNPGLCCGQADWYLGREKAKQMCGQNYM